MMSNSSLVNSTLNICQPRGKLIDDYFEFITIIITYGFTFFTGLIGNAIIIYIVFYFRKMKSVPNMFLANLAFADLLLILFCVPIKCAQLFSFTWQFGLVLCKLIHYIQNLSVINSVYTLTAISIERYFAILYPLKNLTACTEDKTKWLIFAIWILSFTIASPTIYFRTHFPVACGKFYCMLNYDNPMTKFFTLYQVVLILVIPTVILCYTYTAICMKLYDVLSTRSQLTGISSEPSQFDSPSMPNTEIDDTSFAYPLKPPTNQSTNQSAQLEPASKKTLINSPLIHTQTTSTSNSDRTEQTNKIKFSESIELSTLCKFTNVNTSSDFNASSMCKESVEPDVIRPDIDESFNDSQISLQFQEDPNNNDKENKSKIEMKCLKTFRKFTKKSHHDCSNQPTEQVRQKVTLQTRLASKNESNKKMFHLNRNSTKQLQRLAIEKSNDNTAKQIIKMLAIVVVIFILSWAPILIFNLCRGFSIIARFNKGYLKEINTVASLLSYINSCINPFVYGFMSRNFRCSFKTVFKQFFSCCFTSEPHQQSNRSRSMNAKNVRLSIRTN